MEDRPVDELDTEDVLDGVEALHRARVAEECQILELAVRFAVLHKGDTLLPDGRRLPGRQRPVRLGGQGTPTVAEFAPAELGARMQLGPFAAKMLIADGLDCCYRLPRLWARVRAHTARVALVRAVAQATRHLSKTAAAKVDAALADLVDGRLPRIRFERVLAGKVTAADPDAAARREQDEATRTWARASSSTEHGMKSFSLRATAPLVIRFEATVAYLADALAALGDPDPLDTRRVKACLIMANPTHAVRLLAAFAAHRTTKDSHPYRRTRHRARSRRPGRAGRRTRGRSRGCGGGCGGGWAGAVPAHPAAARPAGAAAERPGHQRRVPVRPRPAAPPGDRLPAPVPREPAPRPQRGGPLRGRRPDHPRLHPPPPGPLPPVHHHRRARPVRPDPCRRLRDPHRPPHRGQAAPPPTASPSPPPWPPTPPPSSTSTSTTPSPYQPDGPPGQSRLGNYGLLGRFHHRIKTFGAWTCRQPFPGIWIWRDPHGQHYLVDHTGTRKTGPPHTHAPDPRSAGLHDLDLDTQLWDATLRPVDYTFAHAS